MEEHELIVQVLASLQMLAETLNEGGPVSRPELADFGRFFAEFADRCHHGKEEDRLFRAMVASGFPPESGPIGVMLSEHEAGRQEVRVPHDLHLQGGALIGRISSGRHSWGGLCL